MTILGRLWQGIFDKEENQKHIRAGHAAHQAHAAVMGAPTPLQTKAVVGGALPHNPNTSAGGLIQTSPTLTSANINPLYLQSLQNQQAQLAQQAQSQTIMLTNQAPTTTPGWLYAGGTTGVVGHSVHPGQALGIGTATTGSGVLQMGSGNLLRGGTPYHHLTSTNADTFFLTLRGIEEYAKGVRPEGSGPMIGDPSLDHEDGLYNYDDDAMAIQDLRRFNPRQISLVGVISFCLCNRTDPNPIVDLLEGYGLVLV